MTHEQFSLMSEKIQQEAIPQVPTNEALKAISASVAQEAERRPDQLTELLNKTLAAKQALFEAMKDMGESVAAFKTQTDAYAKDMHAFRASVLLDVSGAKRELEDVRKFFLAKEHTQEVERLKEFIGLCERLRELKRDGTLDAVAETILKLEG